MIRGMYALFLAVAATATVTAQERRPPVDWLGPCELEGVDGTVWCGTYSVFENREARTGRRINLNVAIIPAESPNPEPDPIFYLVGGPGGAATESAGEALWVLQHSREFRDIVLMDQRGTGRSNPLDCDGVAGDTTLQGFFREFLEINFVEGCHDRLLSTADVSLYTTQIAADDIDEVREALGYEEMNLFGWSYGSRAVLIYLRRHPEHARAAVLKGTTPTNMKNPLPFARAAERGLQGLLDACAVDRECHNAFLDLEGDWRRVLRQFEEGPVGAWATHPETGRTETVVIPRGVFMDGVRHILYSMAQARHLPHILHAAADGDFSVFAQHEIDQSIGFNNMLSDGMFMTVTCSEDVRFIEEAEIEPATQGTFLGDYRVRRQLAACSHWDLGDVPESYMEPVRVDTPVLLLSGVYDTATPFEGADWVARHMPNSLHVIAPNESHSFATPECEFRLIGEIFDRGTVEGMDTSCVHETTRPPFAIGGTVP